jgi:FAD/FMN-containing dehydrogenase
MFAVGMAMTPELATAITEHAGRLVQALADRRAESGYLNFAEQPGDAAELFDAATYARLRAIKAAYDPAGLFRGNHDVSAAG